MAGGAHSPYGSGFRPPGYGPPGGGFGPGPVGPPPPAFGAAAQYGPRPGAPYGIEPSTGVPYSDKQKIIGFVLQFFLGAFGAGRFYTGHVGIAIAQIIVTWATCGLGSLWPTIDGIMMLAGRVTDVDGRPLRD